VRFLGESTTHVLSCQSDAVNQAVGHVSGHNLTYVAGNVVSATLRVVYRSCCWLADSSLRAAVIDRACKKGASDDPCIPEA
jgi:hypothetical protein